MVGTRARRAGTVVRPGHGRPCVSLTCRPAAAAPAPWPAPGSLAAEGPLPPWASARAPGRCLLPAGGRTGAGGARCLTSPEGTGPHDMLCGPGARAGARGRTAVSTRCHWAAATRPWRRQGGCLPGPACCTRGNGPMRLQLQWQRARRPKAALSARRVCNPDGSRTGGAHADSGDVRPPRQSGTFSEHPFPRTSYHFLPPFSRWCSQRPFIN